MLRSIPNRVHNSPLYRELLSSQTRTRKTTAKTGG
ncbi:hypothetical protein ACHAXN_010323 [Cyclotella atomus]